MRTIGQISATSICRQPATASTICYRPRWATFAARDRIKSRTLAAFVPDYKAFAEDLNAIQLREQQKAAAKTETSKTPAKTYRALDRFLAEAVQRQTPVCFVAFPTQVLPGKARR